VIRTALVTIGVVALVGLGAAQPHNQNDKAPRRHKSLKIAANKHDRSPALRDIAPLKKSEHREPGQREKRLSRFIRKLKTQPDPIVQNAPMASLIPAPSTSFDGLGNVNGVLPPDTNGDVGPNHYVQSVNVSFAVYSKGSPPALLYGPASLATLWSGFGGPCETRNDGDGIVIYDHLADRWVMSQLAIPNFVFGIPYGPFYQCIAVSATPDPLGAYHRYQFPFEKLNDYPKLGVWPDAYYMSINQFTSGSLQYAGQGLIAFDRQKMLAGLPASLQYVDLASVDINLGGMLPADLDGPAPPPDARGYFVQVDDDAWGLAPQDQLQLWQFEVDWVNPSATFVIGPWTMPVAPFDSDMCGYSRNCIPQAGTTVKVDAMADRLMYRLQYRNFGTHESLVVNHTVDADGTDHAGVRWYEIRNPRYLPFIYQQGTYAPDADHRWMASAAMDAAGNIAIGYSVSGATTFPSIRYTGRLASDAPGTMTQGEAEIVLGTGAQTHPTGRWGDYSLMAVDPVDGCTFWYTQQYHATSSALGWQTRVGTFAFPACTGTPPPPPPAGPTVTLTATDNSATEAGPTNGIVTATRTGPTADPLTVSYSVTGTATPGADYVALSGAVTIPIGASSATINIVPIDDSVSDPGESVNLSLNANPAYTVGSPSQAAVSIVNDDSPPDLMVLELDVPVTAPAGTSITIDETTKNQNSGTAQPSTTGYYLSTNAILDGADTLLSSRAIPQLGPSALNAASVSIPIPAGLATGTYYIIAKADYTNTVSESQEGNNVKWKTTRIGPDLAMSNIPAPPAAGAGLTINVTTTTRNDGSSATGATSTAIYLSANPTWQAGDTLLGTRSVPGIAAGGSSTGSTPVQIPQGTTPGTYYLIAKADVNNVVVETLETNNTSFGVVLRVGPDLTVSAGTVSPSSAAAGGSVTINETTRNAGGGSAAASTTRFYLSANLTFDESDVLVGQRAIGPLAAGASNAGSTVITIPAGTAAGNYYLIAVADGTAAIVETAENNNTRTIFFRVLGGTP
jgi:subtilase family serine protease